MNIEELIRRYLPKARVMQLTTCADSQPWVCSLHYYSDEDLNIYWCSTLERRHSQDIAQNPKVALAIKVHEDAPDENYIIGISITGTAELIGEHIDEIGQAYIKKLGKGPNLLSDIATGKNPHKFYRLKSEHIVLFDSKNFPDQPRQEWQIGAE